MKWLFHIPPVENRPEIKGFLRHLVCYAYDKEVPYTYAFYRLFVINLWLNAIFMALYLYSFMSQSDLELGPLAIRYREDAPVDEFVFAYPASVFPLLAAFSMIFPPAMLVVSTNYFSKTRILTETPDERFLNKKMYEPRPWRFVLPIAFCLTCGAAFWMLPHWCKNFYQIYFDFQGQSLKTLIVYMAIYYLFYVAWFGQVLGILSTGLIRSSLLFFYEKTNRH